MCVVFALSPLTHFYWSYPTWTWRSDCFLSCLCQALMSLKKTCLKAGILSLLSLYFCTQNKLSSSCLSSESVFSWLFFQLWSFSLLSSWNFAITLPLFWSGLSKNGFCVDEKKSPPFPDPASADICNICMEKLHQISQKQIVLKDLLHSAFRKLQFGLIVSFESINRH